MTATLWESLPIRATFLHGVEDRLVRNGDNASSGQPRRTTQRVDAHLLAALRADGEWLAGYVRDVSATGLGILSPIQLFPRQRVDVWVPEQQPLRLTIRRCRRLDEKCYSCGGAFEKGAIAPGQLRRLLALSELDDAASNFSI